MVTLATLEQATAQEVFDQVAKHLLTQGQRSQDAAGVNCLYRSGDLKCAAGCLMTDEEYSGITETGWSSLVGSGSVPSTHQDLITQLQKLHDLHEISEWRNRLATVADNNNLIFKEMEYITKP